MDINFGWHCTPGQLSTSRGGGVGLVGSLWQSGVSQPHGAALLGTTRPAQAASGTPSQPLARPQLLWDQSKLQKHRTTWGSLGPGLGLPRKGQRAGGQLQRPHGPFACPGSGLGPHPTNSPSPAFWSHISSLKSPPAERLTLRGWKEDHGPLSGPLRQFIGRWGLWDWPLSSGGLWREVGDSA